MHAFFLVRLMRIEWRVWPFRIVCYAAFVRQRLVVIRAIPVAAPFPDVARHVVKAVTIRRETLRRRDAGIPIFNRVFHWKLSLPRVRHPFPTGTKIIAPNVCFSRQPAACRKLELRFSRQTFSRPFRICFRVRISDLHYRIFFLPFNVAFRSLRVPPVRAFDVAPPVIMISESDLVISRCEHDAAGDKIFGRRSRKFFFCRRSFRDRHVALRFDEFLELLVCHRRCIHPESIYANAVNGSRVVRRHRHLVRAMAIRRGAHRELTAGNPDHSLWRFPRRTRFVRQCRRECGTSLLRVKPLCQSRAETDNCNKCKNDSPHVSLRSLLRYLLRFPQFSCQPRLSLKASYLWSPFRFCR